MKMSTQVVEDLLEGGSAKDFFLGKMLPQIPSGNRLAGLGFKMHPTTLRYGKKFPTQEGAVYLVAWPGDRHDSSPRATWSLALYDLFQEGNWAHGGGPDIWIGVIEADVLIPVVLMLIQAVERLLQAGAGTAQYHQDLRRIAAPHIVR